MPTEPLRKVADPTLKRMRVLGQIDKNQPTPLFDIHRQQGMLLFAEITGDARERAASRDLEFL